ncbi:single-stranded DNA-binding protein [Peptoniphilus catoniae]|uniref:single-stranded DNA-binding protein n=1 Tax=Peptoniphilus catoniae TaxID=1660341 RepID=UPI0010FDEBBE|nr:single-stranded DNA-binding protein [Peptoniphilus catoniae]
MNNVNLVGRLTKEPELRYSQSGKAVTRFTLAVNRKLSREKKQEAEKNNQPTADFIGCIAFGVNAETLANYISKGNQLAVTGHIQTGSYEKEGQRIYTTDVIIDNFTFIETKKSDNADKEEGYFPVDNKDVPF